MTNRRKLFLAAVLVFATIAVAGWAGSQGEKTAGTLAPYEVKWYFIGNGPQPDVGLVEAELNKFLKDKINATVKLLCFDWGSYNNKMAVMQAAGESFDITFTAAWANSYRQNAAKGYFLDITDLLGKYAPKTRAQLHPAFLSGSAIDGRNYAIPANKELAHMWGFMFRKDYLAKYNLDITTINTFEDIEPMLKVIQDKEPGLVPLQCVGGETGFLTLDYDRIGDDNIPGVLYNDSKDMKVFNEFETPELKHYLKVIRDFYLKGYIPKDAPSITNFAEARSAGKVFATINSLKPLGDDEGTANTGFPYIQRPLTGPVIQTRDATGAMMAISRTSKDAARALMFLEYFNTDKYVNNLVNYGIEGKHYVKVSDNVIDLPAGLTKQNNPYRPNTQWMFGNQYLNYFWKGADTSKWAKFAEFNKAGLPAKSLGFNFDNEPVKTEIAAILSVSEEFQKPLFTGFADPDTVLPQMMEKYKAAGVDKVIAEKQKQLDAWLVKTGKK